MSSVVHHRFGLKLKMLHIAPKDQTLITLLSPTMVQSYLSTVIKCLTQTKVIVTLNL